MNNISEDELDQQKEVSTSIVSKVLAKVPKHFPSIVDNPLYQVSTKLSSVLAIPGRVVFSGFHIMKLRTAKVRIVNKGSTRIRIQLADIPSHGFTITQKKAGFFVPGHYEEIIVNFLPIENRPYSDSFSIATSTGDVLVIPIEAFPHETKFTFPKIISFPDTALSETRTRKLQIKFNGPLETIPFNIRIINDSPFIKIFPLSGELVRVAAKSDKIEIGEIVEEVKISPKTQTFGLAVADIECTYKPLKMSVSSMKIQVDLGPGFIPIVSEIFGRCDRVIDISPKVKSVKKDLKS